MNERHHNENGSQEDTIVTLTDGLPATEEPTERDLFQRFYSCSSQEELTESYWALVEFYNGIERDDLAALLTEMLVDKTTHINEPISSVDQADCTAKTPSEVEDFLRLARRFVR